MRAQISKEFSRKCETRYCRACQSPGLLPILDFGRVPASDGFLDQPLKRPELIRAPLELTFCPQCALLQLLDAPSPETLFGAGYLYLSSGSDTWLAHSRQNAAQLIDRFGLGKDSFVLEIASNDGYLLQYFQQSGVKVLGVEPAPVPASRARERGIPTIRRFFSRQLARELAQDGGADLVVSNNVLAHVKDIHGFIEGVLAVLRPEGTWVIEVPYVGDLVEGCAFDTIYHEHFFYFSVMALESLFSGHGLHINEIQRLDTHGGSLRVFVSRCGPRDHSVRELVEQEVDKGMHRPAFYLEFASRARATVSGVAGILSQVSAAGYRLAAYGAAAKGTMLLNALGSAAEGIDFVVDRNPAKHGKWIPGVNLPILPVTEIEARKPDYLLLLPWNLRKEILVQERAFLVSGGKFIVPLPHPEVVDGGTGEAH